MSRKINYIIITIILILSSCNNKKDGNIVDFVQRQKLTAKDYIISLYEQYDIVILMERDHAEFTEYNLFMNVISDPYFVENVGAVYTEVGVTNLAPKLNSFFNEQGLDSIQINKKVNILYHQADYNHLWFGYSFPWLIKELYKLNRKSDKKVYLYPCDLAFDWNNCKTEEEYDSFDGSEDFNYRDSLMANNFIRQYQNIQEMRNGKKKALVIMNTRHAYLKNTHYAKDDSRENFGAYLKNKFGEKVASVCILGLAHPDNWKDYSVVKNGYWDYCFESNNKTDIGFSLKDTPFGKETFDLIPVGWSVDSLLYQDVFTGLVFYNPIQKHTVKTGWNNTIDDDFKEEFIRRCRFMGFDDEEIKQEIVLFNTVKTSKYDNLEINRERIDKWKRTD
nr:hypothetical protein [uncultured Carboxylicivirga sp.]